MKTTVLKMILGVALFGGIHSLLASRAAKDWTARRIGERNRNAFYRPFFIFQSFLTLGIFAWAVRDLPDRVLYEVRGPLAGLMRLGQVLGFAHATWAAARIGLLRVSGTTGLLAWLLRKPEVPAEPEAQGPALDPDTHRMLDSGPFRISRHPLNFSPLPIFFLFPKMTVRLLAFSLASAVYLVIGSYHEEARLRSAYGQPYFKYERSGVPFYLPRLSRQEMEA